MQIATTYSEMIAKIYYDESLAGADMIALAELLAPLKTKLNEDKDQFLCWSFIDDLLIKSKDKSWINSISNFRNTYAEVSIQHALANVAKAKEISEDEAWKVGRHQYLNYLKAWRTNIASRFLNSVTSIIPSQINNIEEYTRHSSLMLHRRWVEVYSFIFSVAEDENNSHEIRAHFMAVAAAIQMYYIGNYEITKKLLDQADLLCSDEAYVKTVRAGYEIENNNIAAAKAIFESLILSNSNDPVGLNGIGNCFKKEEDYFTAEEWYKKAILAAPGNLESYQNLISLYGVSKRLYEQKKDTIKEIIEKQALIAPEFLFEYYLDAGASSQSANDLTNALAYFEKAISLDPNRAEGHILLGQYYRSQLPTKVDELLTNEFYPKSVTELQLSIELAPTCFDGYWALHILYKQAEQYEKAIDNLKAAYPKCPMFNELCHIELADLYEKKLEFKNASDEFITALKKYPASEQVFENAENYASRLAQYDSSKENGFNLTLSFYHEMMTVITPERKEAFYTFITNAIATTKKDEDLLVQLYQNALIEFPENSAFRSSLETINYNRKFGNITATLKPNITEIVIECDNEVCQAFLKPDANEFTSDFLDKINGFKQRFNEKFGVAITPLIFRRYEFHSNEYHFYTTLDEVYTNIGRPIHFNKKLACCDEHALAQSNIKSIPENSYSPYLNFCWIEEKDVEKIPNNIVIKEPLDLIFEHLQYAIWTQMKRFCTYDQVDFISATKDAKDEIKVSFMKFLHYLLDLHVPVKDKEFLFRFFSHANSEKIGIQQMARNLIKTQDYQAVYPSDTPPFTYYTLDTEIETFIATTFEETAQKQWAVLIDPVKCQELLSAVRSINNLFAKCLVSSDRIAYTMNSICKIEFPLLEFVTKEELAMQQISIDETKLEKISMYA